MRKSASDFIYCKIEVAYFISSRPDVKEQRKGGKRKRRRKKILPEGVFLGMQLRAV